MKTFKFMKRKNVLTFSNKFYKLVAILEDDNIVLKVNGNTSVFVDSPETLETLYKFLDEIHYDDSLYPYNLNPYSFTSDGQTIELSFGDGTIRINKDDLPEFDKFIDAIFKYSKYMNSSPQFQISNASHIYNDQITSKKGYDISLIIETMIAVLDDESKTLDSQFAVFPFPATIEDISPDKLKKMFKPQLNKRYNIGIYAIKTGGDHYLAFILDNQRKELWAFDSLATRSLDRKISANLYVKLYPKYRLKTTDICSGCEKYEPLASDKLLEDYVDQNIFCHTWSLWFIYQMLQGIKSGTTIETLFLLLDNSCGYPRENLITIKKFILWLSANVLDGLQIPHLNKIFDKLDTGLDIHEFIVDSTQLPETFDWDILENIEDPSIIDIDDETDEQRRIRLAVGGWI